MRLEKHHLPIPVALAAGCVAALATLLVPIGVMENFTASSGLSEIIPQTAPPLGGTARMGIAFVAAVVVAGIVLALFGSTARPERGTKETKDMNSVTRLRMPRFGGDSRAADFDGAHDKAGHDTAESWFVRIKRRLDALAGRDGGEERGIRDFDDLPRLHSADRHPDHPPRRPIRAGTDFGDLEAAFPASDPAPTDDFDADPVAEADAPFVDAAAHRPVPVAARAPAPEGWRPLGSPTMPDARDDAMDERDADDGQPYAALDLNDLIDRLEARLRAAPAVRQPSVEATDEPDAEAGPPAESHDSEPIMHEREAGPVDTAPLPPPVYDLDEQEAELPPLSPRPVQAVPTPISQPEEPGDEMDEALRAALETLERMNRRSA